MTQRPDIFEMRSLERQNRKEYWITAAGNPAQRNDVIQRIFGALNAHHADPVSIRLFGDRDNLDAAAASFASAAETAACPPLLILQDKPSQKKNLQAQVHAVAGMSPKPLYDGDLCVGRVFEDTYTTYYMLTLGSDASLKREYAQTKSLFENADRILGSLGLEFGCTIRTWLFARDILSWYDQLNRARNEFFTARGMYDRLIPASTGIEADNLSGSALAVQLLAAVPKTSETSIEVANSPLQNPAMDYKSSFSRGVKVIQPDHQRLYVSGTASIDPEGKTVFVDDTAAQIDLTMRVVEGILTDAGMAWTDAVSAIVYLKHGDKFELFDAYCRAHQIDLPHVRIVADVCRDDLLFELELDAVKR